MPRTFGDAHKAFWLYPAIALMVVACSKSTPDDAKPRASAPAKSYEATVPAMTPEANEALKDRLARQEAAAKLFDKSKPEPPPPAAKAAPVEAPRPAVVATPAPPPAAPAKSEPVPAPVKAAPVEAVKAVPVEAPKSAPAQVAAAAPAPAAAPPSSAIAPAKLVSRADLDYPVEAIRAGVDRGLVKARMTLDSNGNVTKVEVIEANPRRLFDRAVVRSLVNWRFNEGPSGRTVETEVEFKR
jgi:periplasmic protein TonB